MAQDIRDILENEDLKQHDKMSSGHEARFQQKLNAVLPQGKSTKRPWIQIAASVVILLGLGFGVFSYLNQPIETQQIVETSETESSLKSLGDISPDLKKVEDYYLANINLELSKVTLTSDNKDLIDGYISRLDALNAEYKRLSVELTEKGPNELTVNALITNLKFRLNLMHRLKEQLKTLKNSESYQKKNNV